MYQQYPRDLVVSTPLGSVKVAITDDKHAYVESNDVLIISGKPIRVTLHIFLRDGQWTDKNENGRSTIYAKKPDVWTNDEATPLQKEKAIKAVVPTVGNFINANAHLLKQAQAAHVANAVETLEGRIADKRKEIEEMEKEIADLKATL